MTDQIDALSDALSNRYRIEREVGSGGMAVVYLAEDLKHKRKVALKVLRPELAAAVGSERFVREIEIAAQLSHPHILPLYDSGEADGVLYYVMPFVEGESLRDRLDRDGKLPIAETVRLTDEIASALNYAHDQGIVHRDVKPENIMLSGGRAVVADFGIARAVTMAGGKKLTGTGFAVGTPTYMSPEQAFGEDSVDGRSDVYALGCVVYEMVAGQPPFEAETPQALLAKHAAITVPSLRTRDPTIPLFLERAVERTLAKDPQDRFQSPAEFADALMSAVVVARVGRKRWVRPALGTAILGALLISAYLLTLLRGPEYDRLAVLPPTALTDDPDQASFFAGMHDALISELQRVGVPVIARTSMLQYENTQKPIREIATELRVDALIEQSVSRDGDSVEVEVRLVDGTTEEYMADPMVRRSDIRNVFGLYRELTAAIAAEMQVALTPEAEALLATARPVNPDAFEAYLRGQFHLYKLTPVDLPIALQYFDVALGHDPEYATAYAGIALAWAGLQQMAQVPPSEARPQARAAVQRALELDSALVEVQYAKAVVETWVEWDWDAAEISFQRAMELNPNFPDVLAFYAHYLLYMKRPDEAMALMERAMALDPFRALLQGLNGAALLMADRYDEAIAQAEELLTTVPNHPLAHGVLQAAYFAKGMHAEFLATSESYYSAIEFTQATEALAEGRGQEILQRGMRRAAEAAEERARTAWVSPTQIAYLYAFAGDSEQTLAWLERGLEERDPEMPYMSVWPAMDDLRGNPRFQDVLRRMGLE